MDNTLTVKIGDAEVTVQLNAMTFKSGRHGFNGNGKINVGDKKYQISANVILIESRDSAGKKK